MKKISVIIPSYQSAAFIAEAVTSCFQQGFKDCDIEVIIVDDGSDEETKSLLREIDLNCNVNVRYSPSNMGPANARNIGIGLSQGKYVAFLDSDDFMEEGKLKLQYDFLEENTEFDLIITSIREVEEDGSFIRDVVKDFPYSKNDQILSIFLGLISSITPTLFFRKSLVEKAGFMDESLRYMEDRFFLLKLLLHGDAKYMKIPLTNRRVVKGGLSNSITAGKFIETRTAFLEKSINLFPWLSEFAAEYWSKQFFGLGKILQTRGDVANARTYYKKSLQSKIKFLSLLGLLLSYFPVRLQKK